MTIAVLSIPHSGTHFAKSLFNPEYLSHVFPDTVDEWIKGAREQDMVIVPLRHPFAILKSWKNIRPGRIQAEMAHYFELLERVVDRELACGVPFYLPVDLPGERDDCLEAINIYAGREYKTDWQPVRQAHPYELPGQLLKVKDLELLPITVPFTRFYGAHLERGLPEGIFDG